MVHADAYNPLPCVAWSLAVSKILSTFDEQHCYDTCICWWFACLVNMMSGKDGGGTDDGVVNDLRI